MKKFSDKARRILRMIYRGLGATAVSLLFQACYGTPLDMEITLHGEVRSRPPADNPIPGIQVSVENFSSQDLTNEQGKFYVHVPRQESYKLTFEDSNSSYKTQEETVTPSAASSSLVIYLDAAP